MSASDIAIVAFFGALTIVAGRRVPLLWRNQTTMYDRVPSGWLWSAGAWRAVVRSGPVLTCAMPIWVAAIMIGPLVPAHHWAGFARPWWYVVPAIGVLLVGLALFGSIVLINRPKLLVPPHLRGERGVLR